MKRIVILAILMVLLTVPAIAETTSHGVYKTPCPRLTQWLNENPDFYHNHDYDVPKPVKFEYGVGADIKVIDFTKFYNTYAITKGVLNSIEIQYKYDIDLDIHKAYGVVKLDLSRLWQRKY